MSAPWLSAAAEARRHCGALEFRLARRAGPDIVTSGDGRPLLVGGAKRTSRLPSRGPSDSRLHEGRARAFWAQALLDPENAPHHLDAALASSACGRAGSENPFPH